MRRKLIVLAIVTLVAVLLFVLAGKMMAPAPASHEGERPSEKSFDVGIPTMEKVEAFVQGYGSRVEATEADLARLRTELEETRKALQESKKSRSEDLALVKSLLEDLKRTTASDSSRSAGPTVARVRKFEFTLSADQAKAPGKRSLHIPAGSFGEVTLLTGIFAPVAGEALPIHAKLNVALVGPNRTRIPIEDAFLVGRVQGDANSARALVQFQKLTLVAKDGTTYEVAINADVADGDGVLGLAGRYVWRADEVLALAGLSGAAAGWAEAFAAREITNQLSPLGGSTSILTGDPMKFGMSRGLGKGLERLSEIVGKRLDEIVPAVWVPNAKKATILFLEGVTLEGLEVTNEVDVSPYRGLDFDR